MVVAGGVVLTPVGGGLVVGFGEEGSVEAGFELEEDGVADVMRVDCGVFCRTASWAKEEVGSMKERKRRLEENGRLDFEHWHARLDRVFRRISMMDNVYKKNMYMDGDKITGRVGC